MNHISSRQNALVARFKAAARRDEPGLMLLDGEHLVHDALRAGTRIREVLVALDATERQEISTLIGRIQHSGALVCTATPAVMAAASPVHTPSAVVATAERPVTDAERAYAGRPALVLIACDVQDPGNLGAMVRVAEAGGASALVAAGRGADPFGWKALRGSMGSALRLPIVTHGTLAAAVVEARRHGCRIVATAPRHGQSLFDADLAAPLAVLIGGEGAGLAHDVLDAADERVTIPMQSPVESLNAAVTAALIVYEVRRQALRAPR